MWDFFFGMYSEAIRRFLIKTNCGLLQIFILSNIIMSASVIAVAFFFGNEEISIVGLIVLCICGVPIFSLIVTYTAKKERDCARKEKEDKNNVKT